MTSYSYTTLNDPSSTINNPSPYGINDQGQIVGGYVDASGFHSFLYSGGSYTTVDDPSATPNTAIAAGAGAINANGQIVGYYADASGTQHGFLDSGGIFTTLDDPSATNGTLAQGINDNGQIVGSYRNASGSHGFLESGGIFTTLDDPLTTGANTGAAGINNNGQIVGTYNDASGIFHGYLYSGGIFTTIDDPLATVGTAAQGINNNGQIVGYYIDASGVHGFLDSGGVFTTLSDPSATGETAAFGINDNGQIAGVYDDASGRHGFLATPVPPALSFIGPVIDAAADTAWPVTVSGLGGENGTLVFGDTSGHNVSVNIAGDGTYLANLSTLIDGPITSTLSAGGQSVSGSPLTLVGAPLPQDAHITLSPNSTGDLGKVGTDSPSVIDASQTSNVTFKTGNGPDVIIAGVNDVVHAGTGHDTLVGANGATLYAGSGPETFFGAPGETLIGGSGADTFAFEPGSGQNTVSNFHTSNDVIQFNPALFMNYANMMSSGAITQSGANTVINDHAGDTITLLGVAASSLTAHNFSFKA